MVTVSAQPDGPRRSADLPPLLEDTLDALLEFTGATAGWVGLADPEGRLQFPARRGTFPQAWLALQQGQLPVWGFEIREGPTLLNDLPALPALGDPPLRNLLSCQLRGTGSPAGQIVLANKPHGFTSHDALVLQGIAHLLCKRLAPRTPPALPWVSTPLLQRALDWTHEGILIVDQTGTLLFANATWASWTGFRPEELANHPAPFPFWVSLRDLATAGGARVPDPSSWGPHPAAAVQNQPAQRQRLGCLPFRHRKNTVFWCQVEIARDEMNGQPVTLAFLRRLPTSGRIHGRTSDRVAAADGPAVSFQALAEELPIAVALTDQHGAVLWVNAAFAQQLQPTVVLPGQLLRSALTTTAAAALEQLLRNPRLAEPGRRGCLQLAHRDRSGVPQDLVAHWLAVALPEGPGFLFALAEDWGALWPVEEAGAPPARVASRPAASWLAMLYQPGRPIEWWDERWEQLTGLTHRDLAGVAGELVLDWLFPRQRDRDFVADLLHQAVPRGTQAVLEVVSCTGSRPRLCTLLPVAPPADRGSRSDGSSGRTEEVASIRDSPASSFDPRSADPWLVLVCEPESIAGEDSGAQRLVRQFARGLSHLLNNYLAVPVGLAEMALDRGDLPVELASWFHQILESRMRANPLIASLQDLAAVTPGELQLLSLAALVQEFLNEHAAETPPRTYEVSLEVDAPEALVRVNPRMLKVVLKHLLTNAEHALRDRLEQRLEIRVFAGEGLVGCAIEDTGGGLPTTDPTAVLAPFYSTKGAFARDARQATLEATGLGLTVSQHLLGLHGGRLELRTLPGEGTTAALFLPRSERMPPETGAPRTGSDSLRADASQEAGPQA